MPNLGRGQASSCANPVLDLYTYVGRPPVAQNVDVLEFRILDISTAAKRADPVQVYPATPGTYQALDPTTDCPTGHRLATGHFVAAYTVDPAEEIGDHLIEWRFQQTVSHPVQTFQEEFYVAPSMVVAGDPYASYYCTVQDLRDEGYDESLLGVNPATGVDFTADEFDARALKLIGLASRFVDKMTGRWFYPKLFNEDNRFMVDGQGGWRASPFNQRSGSRVLHLEIPVIRVDRLYIRSDGTFNADLTEIDLSGSLVQVYNRHLRGLTQPDDRENPRIAFTNLQLVETIASGLYPAPHVFPRGRLNVEIEGVFGYTDPDGTPLGQTPDLVRQATCRLVGRELLLDSDECEKLNVRNKFRIKSDKEGSTTITLQDLWLKGAFTGDPVIDQVLMSYKRPPRITAV